MKKSNLLTWLGILLLTAVAAVASGSPPPALAQGAYTPSATGHGQIADKGGAVQTFSFSANVQADGSEQGQGEIAYRFKGDERRLHIDIDCIVVEKNMATLSGIVTHSSDANEINDRVVIQVVDNGEGINDAPDTMSVLQISDPLKCITCRTPLKLQQVPIDRGNIQVRTQ